MVFFSSIHLVRESPEQTVTITSHFNYYIIFTVKYLKKFRFLLLNFFYQFEIFLRKFTFFCLLYPGKTISVRVLPHGGHGLRIMQVHNFVKFWMISLIMNQNICPLNIIIGLNLNYPSLKPTPPLCAWHLVDCIVRFFCPASITSALCQRAILSIHPIFTPYNIF